MKISKYIFIGLVLFAGSTICGKAELNNIAEKKGYNVSNIPVGLRNKAGTVVRKKIIQFEIVNDNTAILKETRAVTIFRKDDINHGQLILWYDKFREVEELEGTIYNSKGEEIRELENREIYDYSAFGEYNLYDDARVKLAELYHNIFPYTVEFKYEVTYDGFLNWPTWVSQETIAPVELSSFKVILKNEQELRYWCNKDSVSPVISYSEDGKVFTWEANNLAELEKDAVNEDLEEVSTVVRIAPSKFELEGYSGDMYSWEKFGLWFYNLSEEKAALHESAHNKIKSIINPVDDDYTKVKKLYKYLQSHTRYISVQLGIGGWQPFDAKYVSERGYGDCKALTNYMHSILKTVNIQSFPVLIKSGSYRYTFINEFPSNQFNHVILCVPLQNDTVWLECTSQSIPFGKISSSNENRNALMITKNGGIVVKTPISSAVNNSQYRKADVIIKSAGNADANVVITWFGNQQVNVRNILEGASPKDQENWILKKIDAPNTTLESHTLSGMSDDDLPVKLSLAFELNRYATTTGNRLFFKPNLMERKSYIPKDVKKRLSPIRYSFPYCDIDSVYYTIPSDYSIESLPAEVNLQYSFGEFICITEAVENNKILFTRKLSITEYEFSADNYPEYRAFMSGIVKSDRSQVILKKN
ncbi:MAG: DUF3857 domain-containing protein [Bacteroidetes bacterium]|nr:DUF3857 domain-containing protein [Bacteroidota bacterium]